MRTNGHPVTLESVEKVKYTLRDFTEVVEREYKPLSEEDMKMVAAIILLIGASIVIWSWTLPPVG